MFTFVEWAACGPISGNPGEGERSRRHLWPYPDLPPEVARYAVDVGGDRNGRVCAGVIDLSYSPRGEMLLVEIEDRGGDLRASKVHGVRPWWASDCPGAIGDLSRHTQHVTPQSTTQSCTVKRARTVTRTGIIIIIAISINKKPTCVSVRFRPSRSVTLCHILQLALLSI